MTKEGFLRKVANLFATLLLALVILAALSIFLSSHLFGWRFDSVTTGSMEPTFPVGGVVVITPIEPGTVEIGDIITYKAPIEPDMLITHATFVKTPLGLILCLGVPGALMLWREARRISGMIRGRKLEEIHYRSSRWATITRGLGSRREALHIKKKYKGTIVDVEKLPKEEAIIPVSSLEDLIGLSDQLTKPVLHKVPATPEGTHVYSVFDGSTRYEYLLGEREK